MKALPAIAMSGLGAADLSLRAHAHNIANANTDGFRRSGTVHKAEPDGGVRAVWTRDTVPGQSLEADLLGQLQAKNAALANLAVFKTWDHMTGSLLRAVG